MRPGRTRLAPGPANPFDVPGTVTPDGGDAGGDNLLRPVPSLAVLDCPFHAPFIRSTRTGSADSSAFACRSDTWPRPGQRGQSAVARPEGTCPMSTPGHSRDGSAATQIDGHASGGSVAERSRPGCSYTEEQQRRARRPVTHRAKRRLPPQLHLAGHAELERPTWALAEFVAVECAPRCLDCGPLEPLGVR